VAVSTVTPKKDATCVNTGMLVTPRAPAIDTDAAPPAALATTTETFVKASPTLLLLWTVFIGITR
jgi:hypothetical protein